MLLSITLALQAFSFHHKTNHKLQKEKKTLFYKLRYQFVGVGEMAQRLRAHVLEEDLGSTSNIDMAVHNYV